MGLMTGIGKQKGRRLAGPSCPLLGGYGCVSPLLLSPDCLVSLVPICGSVLHLMLLWALLWGL